MKPYQFKAKLIDDIRMGRLAAGDYIGTTRELVERHGMSAITINRTLASMVSEGLVERVRNRGTYVSSCVKASKSLRIGLVFEMPRKSTASDQLLLAAFQIFPDYAKQCCEELKHVFTEYSYKELREKNFDSNYKLDGLLVNCGGLDQTTIPNLFNKPYPIVVIQHCAPKTLPFHQVVPDLLSAYVELIAQLQKEQIKELTILRVDNPTHTERQEVFLQAATYNNYPAENIKSIILDIPPGDFGQLAGYKLGLEALKTHCQGKVYISLSDIVSCGILSAFLENKLHPNQDFKLISFDNLEEDKQLFFEKAMLTSVDFPKKDIVKRAMQLIEMEATKKSQEKYIIKVPCKIIERETFRHGG